MATPPETRVTLGEKIGRLREADGRSQRELARVIGISYSAVSLIERGERPNPGIWTVHAIAVELGVSMAELLRDVKQ